MGETESNRSDPSNLIHICLCADWTGRSTTLTAQIFFFCIVSRITVYLFLFFFFFLAAQSAAQFIAISLLILDGSEYAVCKISMFNPAMHRLCCVNSLEDVQGTDMINKTELWLCTSFGQYIDQAIVRSQDFFHLGLFQIEIHRTGPFITEHKEKKN